MVIDALSDYAFYEKGLVEHPIPANNHIQPFIDHGVPGLWTYYCCAQGVDVPNRFFAMPSARNRIMGVLMYLYEIRGFLQWGYNFYNSGFSRKHIDPFSDTHADYSFPSEIPSWSIRGRTARPVVGEGTGSAGGASGSAGASGAGKEGGTQTGS